MNTFAWIVAVITGLIILAFFLAVVTEGFQDWSGLIAVAIMVVIVIIILGFVWSVTYIANQPKTISPPVAAEKQQ